MKRSLLYSVLSFMLIFAFLFGAFALWEGRENQKETEKLVAALLEAIGSGEDEESILTLTDRLAALMKENQAAQDVHQEVNETVVSVLTYYEGASSLGYGGSGFFIREDGLIATAFHVIRGAEKIKVRTADKAYHEVAYVAGYDEKLDIAILKIDKTDCKPVKIADSLGVAGDKLFALGRNSGADFTYSTGILSNVGDQMASYPGRRLLRFCNLIEKGDSGCPIFNERGEVIGMCQLGDPNYGVLGWAIEIGQVMEVAADKSIPVKELSAITATDLTPYLSYRENTDGSVTVTGLKTALTDKMHTVRFPAVIDGKEVKEINFESTSYQMTEVSGVILPEGVRRLGRAFLSESSKIRAVHIPESVTEIAADAFYGARSLTRITFDTDALITRDDNLYSRDGSILYYVLSLPEDGTLSLAGVKTVGACAAYGKKVTALTDMDTLEAVEAYAFTGNRMTSLHLPDTLTRVGEYAFANAALLEDVVVGRMLTVIGKSAFRNLPLLSRMTLSDQLTKIESYAFYGCGMLTEINLPKNLFYIGDSAFERTGLLEVTLPDGLTYLGAKAFYRAPLTRVVFQSLPYLAALNAFGEAENIENTFFVYPMGETVTDPLLATLFKLGKK